MASIPPTGGPSEPPPPQESKQELAGRLSQATDEFTKKTYEVLQNPHLADDHGSLEIYAKCILNLHQLAEEAGG